MGQATSEVQGYPTQVWVPQTTTPLTRNIVALLHDRRGKESQPGVFFIPGNRIDLLFTPGTEQYTVAHDGKYYGLRIPDSVLWSNHGGPCQYRGAEYYSIGPKIMAAALALCLREQVPVVIPGSELGTKVDFKGPFDYYIPNKPPDAGEKPKLHLMGEQLLRASSVFDES